MSDYTIRPLSLGTIRHKKGNMSHKCGVTNILDFPLISYYVEGASHKIIVDKGGTPPDGVIWQPKPHIPNVVFYDLNAMIESIKN